MAHQSAVKNSQTPSLNRFFEQFTPFALKPDDILITSHTITPQVFYLTSGIVKQIATTQKGQDLTLNLFKPGSFFPLMNGLLDLPNTYAFVCVTECSGFKAPLSKVKEYLQSDQMVAYSVMLRLLSGLHGMLQKTEKLMQGDALSLLIQTLLTLSERFPGDDAQREIKISLTHQQLAELTGLSRETVTRELSVLRSENLISIQQHHIKLLDMDSLQSKISACEVTLY